MNNSARSILNVVAHQDDDLYFMNPDLVRSLQDGDRVTTVVLTAGEGDGINIDTGDPDRADAEPDHAGYSAARGCGLRSAYARMATGDRDSAWRRETKDLVAGFAVERFTLIARPAVQLYFCQLHMGAFRPGGGDRTRLFQLWDGSLDTQATLPVRGSALTEVQHVDRETVIAGLAALLAELRPTTVRTLDPDPEHDGGKEGYVPSDHVDHTTTAEFAVAALLRHRETDAPAPVVEYYRAYANRFWGQNLDAPELAEKADYLAVYAGLGSQECPEGLCERCGDRQLGPNPYRSTHMVSCAARYSPATGWLRLGPGDRLQAFAVLGGRPVMWSQARPGSDEWHGPVPLGEGWHAPSLAVAGTPGGPAHLVALRRQAPDAEGPAPELVYAVQDAEAAAAYAEAVADGGPAPDRAGFGDWRPLGNPDADEADPRRRRELGVPLAALDGEGRLHVFARDFAQGISLRRQDTDGVWRPWESIGGGFVQDAGAALTRQDGTVELYVPGKKTVLRWFQDGPGGNFERDTTLKTGVVATGGIAAVDSGDNRTCLYFREAGTQQVMAYRQHDNGRWPGGPAGVGGAGGTGAVAALWAAGRGARDAFLAHRSSGGRLTVSLPHPDRAVGGPRWRESGESFAHAPSLAYDATGALVAAVIGTDGRLHVRRALTPDAGSPFGPDLVI
ncbi:PIG-L family deacetylase [Streptomyces bambusae]|uniref:GlcNAc-PI de-N-acetylase n=1 Tax=Streptomyces bambusae TaxID=1550616 RepID=A0ABS6Z751_9ACTN|nr:PIG-L family deacetylase [Streptomyces bambusae]MBW5483599.1 hypothetical protein [Streptomyces bambusae]